MKPHFYLMTLFVGIILGLHLTMNARVGSALNNLRVSSAIFWVIGAVTAVAIGLTGYESGVLSSLKQVNPVLLTAGAMGACIVFYFAWAIPQIGAGATLSLVVSGQILFGIIASHYGWLGSPVQPISLIKIVGVLLMFAGIFICFPVKYS
jgi:transporter family-2 protein